MTGQFLGANPILPVKDVRETTRFYKQKLGFEIIVLWEEPAYGVVKRGGTVLEFGDRRQAHAGSGVCSIHVSNADKIYEEFSAKGIEFVGDLADRDYGCRDFRVRDNNGNMLIIGHDLENQDELLCRLRAQLNARNDFQSPASR